MFIWTRTTNYGTTFPTVMLHEQKVEVIRDSIHEIIINFVKMLLSKPTLLFKTVNWFFLQCMHTAASASGTQTAACSDTAFLPPRLKNPSLISLTKKMSTSTHDQLRNLLFLSRSSIHLLICAIHSCFSVEVAAYTANDLEAVRISQPLRNSVRTYTAYSKIVHRKRKKTLRHDIHA